MRNTFQKVIFVIILIFSKLLFSQIIVGDEYKKIPDSLFFKDKIYQYIIPNEKYEYWKVSRKDDTPNEELIYESRSSQNLKYLKKYSAESGFFWECLPDGCFSYIVAYKNKNPQYFTSEKEFRNFIGFIDNLPEALLIAKTYGFWFDKKEKIGGSYKMDNNYVYLYLAKFSSCLVSSESFTIKINRKTQEIEYKSNGIYYKTDKCYSS